MKQTIFTLFLFLVSLSFAQEENPWENPKTENPWENSETKKEKPVSNTATDNDSSSAIHTKNDNESDISLNEYKNEMTPKERLVINKEIERQAEENYESKGDFAIGFGCGLVLNGVGIVPAMASSFIPTTKMDRAISKTVEDESLPNVPDEIKRKRSKIGIQNKRLLNALGGACVGAIAQIAILLSINLF